MSDATAADESEPEPASTPVGPSPRVAIVAVVAAIAPIVVAVWRAVADGWIPIGDNAYFAIRARDVFTSHHPLLGTWTSASRSLGVDVNNPGPLLFDLHALPAKIDGDIGLAIGVAAVNALCVVGIAVFARRIGGTRAVVLAMVPAAGLAWTMGSELLFDPWQPHTLLFPFLLTLFLAWAACAADLAALPWLAGVGSLVFETHLTYAYLVPTLWLVTAVAVVLDARRGPEHRRHLGRWLGVTAIVLVLCWLQPVIEQLTGPGKGNLARLADATGAGDGIGLGLGGRLVAAVVALPLWWSRSTFTGSVKYDDVRTIAGPHPELRGVPTGGAALTGLLVVGAGLLVCAVLARRSHDRGVGAGVTVSVAALFGGLLTASSTPLGVFGIAPHQLRWLWPLALFVTFTFVVALASGRAPRAGPALALAAVIVLSIVAMPRAPGVAGPSLDANAIPVVRELNRQLGALEGRGPVVLSVENLRFAEPYSIAIEAELQRRGIEFRSTDEGIIRQLGPSRRAEGDEPTRLVMVEGAAASEPMAGAVRVAYASTMTAADRRELARLTTAVSDVIATDGLPLSELGEAARAVDALPIEPEADGVYRLPRRVVVDGQLMHLVQLELVEPEAADRDLFERWAELRYRADRETVGLFAIANDVPDG